MPRSATQPGTSTLKQKQLEALALELAETPEVRQAREAARQIFLSHPYAATPDGAASLEDAARQHFYGALHLVTNTDPHYPEILMACTYRHAIDGQEYPSSLHGGLENPDNIYRLIPISADSCYELKGRRHRSAPAQVTYELMNSIPGVTSIGHQIGLLMDSDMEVASDGSFTITIGPEPANGRPNHIRSTPEARVLFIRDTLSDWEKQTPDRLRITRTAGPDTPFRSWRDLVDEAAALVPAYAQFWNAFRDMYVKKHAFKTNAFDPPAIRTGGWGFIANTHFAIGEDEAFVFTADPSAAAYHAVLIGNHWWIACDADRRSGAFNTAQSKPNRDGTITYVIAADDPAVHNWLDTGGLHEGIVQVRWQGTAAGTTALPDAIREARVVKLAGLKQALREETTRVTPQERQAQLDARHAAYQRRFSLP